MASNQTLASAPTSGTKLQQMLLVLKSQTTCNLFFKEPRCLHRVNRNSLPCSYYVNSKAWMRSDIFNIMAAACYQINKINVNAQAWNLVKAEPIVNCWRKTGISPTVNENGDDSIHYPTSSNCTGNGKSRESRGH
uniref:DDE-1 domain-containing protein n=1 Tax=Rhizophagus irregularis (strain DAOM 181602 / DAOM 197198 / MUCL 43194) TaxID=747089 RepID=U9TEV0_RHIID